MSDEDLHRNIVRELGGMAESIKGIHEELKRINGRITANSEKAQTNAIKIADLKGSMRNKAVGYGAGSGVVIAGLVEIIKSLIK